MRKRSNKLLVLLAYGAGSLVLILVLLTAAVRIQEWIFRDRAERLFSDIQSIDPLRTTFDQTNSIFERWHGSVSYKLPCSKQYCELNIGIVEPSKWHTSRLFPRLLDLYRLLGGHPAIASADITVKDGVVSSKHYELVIEAPPDVGTDGHSLTYYMEGNISTQPRADTSSLGEPGTRRHPEYEIGSVACLGCLEIHASFTPLADPADVRRLSRINFSCLTRQHPCRTKSDIMPSAASESLQENLPSNGPY
jgi:hypothetical protein